MQPSSEWRLRTAGGIPIRILGRTGGFDRENASASEEYIIPANRLYSFALECLPRPYVVADGSLRYPRTRPLPGLPTLVTKSIKWEGFTDGVPVDPFGSDSGAPDGTYQEYIKVSIEYETVPNNDEEDSDDPQTYLEISANASGTFLASPIRGTAKWDLGPWEPSHGLGNYPVGGGNTTIDVTEIDVPQTVRQPEVEWSVRWPQIPYEYWTDELVARLRSKLGKVNEDEMSLFHDAPAETVMFLSWSMKQSFTWRDGEAGKSPVEVDMRFLEKNFEDSHGEQVTHNHVYRPGWGWTTLLIDGQKMYATTNLDAIFKDE
jgi:hypothetical protein